MTNQRRTLSFRLTLWYTGIYVISSIAAFSFFYLLMTSIISQRTDHQLTDEIKEIATLLETEGLDAVKTEINIEAESDGVEKIFFRLIDKNDSNIASSNMDSWKELKRFSPLPRSMNSGDPPMMWTVSLPGHKYKTRIAKGMITPDLSLEIGISLEDSARFIETFQKIFISTLSVLLVFAVLIGHFMSRKALKGIEAVTIAARNISKGNFEYRVPKANWGEEIDELSETFNQMANQIQLLLREMRELNDNIAHDLRSPITKIRGVAEMALTSDKSPDRYEFLISNTIEECDRLLEIINTMLVISETESGFHKNTYDHVDIFKIIANAVELFSTVAEDKEIAIVNSIEGSCIVLGNMNLLQRLIANLIDNSLKFTQPHGTIDIKSETISEKEIKITINDTGIGMPEDEIQHVFKRFYQVDRSRSEGGNGLGLSLAQSIAKSHGGRLEIASVLHKGTTIAVFLPILHLGLSQN